MKSFTIYHLPFTILAVVASICFTACNLNEPGTPILDSYPRKHLIEEFTGQDCGYCPYGMNCISEFMNNDTNYVLILHHYGYKKDHFSVAGSKTIMSALNASGAPSMSIDRAKTKYKNEYGQSVSSLVFHPTYLSTTNVSQFETTTYASIHIENSYDASSRELSVRVYGELSTKDAPALKLTVLVKESGMIDYQADYNYSYQGWQEFRHANAVRVFLSEAKGDDVYVSKQRYATNYSVKLDESWVPENCMVVAFLSEDFKPVVQAEQKPVVDGTKGGADITHGGVTPVPVPDYYPEPSATAGPSDYSGAEADTLKLLQTQTQVSGDRKLWMMYLYNDETVVTVNKTACIPLVCLYLVTTADQTTIPAGTYELNTSENAGTVIAGYRDDEKVSIDGSTYYYTDKSYFSEGYLNPQAQWLIADGTMTVTEEGWELIGHAMNGSNIHLVGAGPLKNNKASNAPLQLKRL